MQTARAGISSFAGAAGFCASWHPPVIAASRTRVTGAHCSLDSGKHIGVGLAGYKCATSRSKILVLNTTSARVTFGCQLVGVCCRAQVGARSITSEETMSREVRRGHFNIVHQVRLDDEMLREIADLLGIPQAERSRIISGEIIVGPPPVSPSGTAPPTPPSGAAPPTPPSGRRRQRK